MAADSDSQLHLGGTLESRRYRTVAGIYAEVFRVNFIEGKTESAQPLTYDCVGGACFLQSVGPGINQGADRFPAIRKTNGEFERGRASGAAYSGYSDPILSILLQ